ncbi:Erythroid transcription factor [Podila humilis]|nr:Erythroid transcription factor [Podila humilis]
MLLLYLATCASGLPTNSTLLPLDDPNGDVILDVGQHVKVTAQNIALGTTLIITGIIHVFYGFKFIRITLLLTGFLSWAILAMMIMVAIRWDLVYTTFMPNHYYLWVWISSGFLGAFLSFRYWDLGVTFIGAFGGFALAMGIIAAANLRIENAGRYIIMSVLILAGAAFATFYERVFVVVATSFGGAYLCMYGIDEFVQVGYREMIVIFDFTGKTFTYHPNMYVYVMLGSSILLAGLGIGWEFWHHETPLWMDRKAVFRIYGRPFGKRPKRLVGQRIKHHAKSSRWYNHIFGGVQRWTEDDVLYGHNSEGSQVCETCVEHSPSEVITEVAPTGSSTEQLDPPSTKTQVPKVPVMPQETTLPQMMTPTHVDDSAVGHGNSGDGNPIEILVPDLDVGGVQSKPIDPTQETDMAEGYINAQQPPEACIPLEIATLSSSASPASEPPPCPSPSRTIEHPGTAYHPLFDPRFGQRTMEMIHMVTDDSPGNTIPTQFLLREHQPQQRFAVHDVFSSTNDENHDSRSAYLRSNLEIIQDARAAVASPTATTATTEVLEIFPTSLLQPSPAAPSFNHGFKMGFDGEGSTFTRLPDYLLSPAIQPPSSKLFEILDQRFRDTTNATTTATSKIKADRRSGDHEMTMMTSSDSSESDEAESSDTEIEEEDGDDNACGAENNGVRSTERQQEYQRLMQVSLSEHQSYTKDIEFVEDTMRAKNKAVDVSLPPTEAPSLQSLQQEQLQHHRPQQQQHRRRGSNSPTKKARGNKLQKKDPLAHQVWTLFTTAKCSLPNGHGRRLENLTWRLKGMSLNKPLDKEKENEPLMSKVVYGREDGSGRGGSGGGNGGGSEDHNDEMSNMSVPTAASMVAFSETGLDNQEDGEQALEFESDPTPTYGGLNSRELEEAAERQDTTALLLQTYASAADNFADKDAARPSGIANIRSTDKEPETEPSFPPLDASIPRTPQQPSPQQQSHPFQQRWLDLDLTSSNCVPSLDSLLFSSDTSTSVPVAESDICSVSPQLHSVLSAAQLQDQHCLPYSLHQFSDDLSWLDGAMDPDTMRVLSDTFEVPEDNLWTAETQRQLQMQLQQHQLLDPSDQMSSSSNSLPMDQPFSYDSTSHPSLPSTERSVYDNVFNSNDEDESDSGNDTDSTVTDSEQGRTQDVAEDSASEKGSGGLLPNSTKSKRAVIVVQPPMHCNNCKTQQTSLWRRSVDGHTLCNACALFYKLHGKSRPKTFKSNVIKTRNRTSIASSSKRKSAAARSHPAGSGPAFGKFPAALTPSANIGSDVPDAQLTTKKAVPAANEVVIKATSPTTGGSVITSSASSAAAASVITVADSSLQDTISCDDEDGMEQERLVAEMTNLLEVVSSLAATQSAASSSSASLPTPTSTLSTSVPVPSLQRPIHHSAPVTMPSSHQCEPVAPARVSTVAAVQLSSDEFSALGNNNTGISNAAQYYPLFMDPLSSQQSFYQQHQSMGFFHPLSPQLQCQQQQHQQQQPQQQQQHQESHQFLDLANPRFQGQQQQQQQQHAMWTMSKTGFLGHEYNHHISLQVKQPRQQEQHQHQCQRQRQEQQQQPPLGVSYFPVFVPVPVAMPTPCSIISHSALATSAAGSSADAVPTTNSYPSLRSTTSTTIPIQATTAGSYDNQTMFLVLDSRQQDQTQGQGQFHSQQNQTRWDYHQERI